MTNIWTLARKELRGFFGSPVAVIFLASFLSATLFTFFWVEKFFARGTADVRPMFEWMPILLIFLVAALAMRLWSEEKKVGTIEILLTLPVPRWQLVLGKFVAGMALIGLALAMTLSLPILVSGWGDLDWGPVLGGYLGALLLAAAYLAIGMCVSAATDNQIVALIATLLVGGLMYLPGVAAGGTANATLAEVLRLLGTGTRFASIARGVVDVRDLAYYLSLTGVFLGLNGFLLGRQRWGRGVAGRRRRHGARIGIALVAVNAVLLNLWLAPVTRARLDVTEYGAYSLSSTTKQVVSNLHDTLLVRGYFSSKTHPLLAPLIPQIRDLLEEYRLAGDSHLRVEMVDPGDDESVKQEAKEKYDIQATPLRFTSKSEKSVLNAYFAIVIAYGDQHVVLGLDELLAIKQLDIGDMEIHLGNFEYEVTRGIKKVIAGFQSVDALFASLGSKVELTAYITPDTLPEAWKAVPAQLQQVVDELTKESGGKLTYTVTAPKDLAEAQSLADRFGIEPYPTLGGKPFYLHLLLKVGDRMVRIVPPEHPTAATLKQDLLDGLKHAVPGFTHVVGLWVPPADPPDPQLAQMYMQMGQQPPPGQPAQSFEGLRQALSGSYEVHDVELAQPIPDDVEVLVLAGPARLDATAARSVDQFVMRGGALVALTGRYRAKVSARGITVQPVVTGLEDMFKAWGIEVGESLVLDEHSQSFLIEVPSGQGDAMTVERRMLPFPYIVKVEDGARSDGLITGGLAGALMYFTSPVKVAADAPARAGAGSGSPGAVATTMRTIETLLHSSAASWLSQSPVVAPDFRRYPDVGFGKPEKLAADQQGEQPLAVSIIGGLPSSLTSAPGAQALTHSPPATRVVVIGSSSFVADDVLRLAQGIGSDLTMANVTLVQNAIDWALADDDMLEIRNHSANARVLTLPDDARTGRELLTYVVILGELALVVGLAYLRRRRVRPIVTAQEVVS